MYAQRVQEVLRLKKSPGGSGPRMGVRQKEVNLQSSETTIEILVEGQQCPFCRFAKLKREGNEIVCPICGYGHKPCA